MGLTVDIIHIRVFNNSNINNIVAPEMWSVE